MQHISNYLSAERYGVAPSAKVDYKCTDCGYNEFYMQGGAHRVTITAEDDGGEIRHDAYSAELAPNQEQSITCARCNALQDIYAY